MNKKRLKFIAVPTVLLVVGILFTFIYLGADSEKEVVQTESKQNEKINTESNKGKMDDTESKKNKEEASDSKNAKDVASESGKAKEVKSESETNKDGESKSEKVKVVIDAPSLALENYDKIVVGDKKTGKGGSTYEDVVALLGNDASYKSSTMSKVKLDEFEWFDNDMMLADESLSVKFKDGLVFEKTFKEGVIWTE